MEENPTNIYYFSLSGDLQMQRSQVEEFATTTELPAVAQDKRIITHLSMAQLQWWCQGGIIIQQNGSPLSLCLRHVPEQSSAAAFVSGCAWSCDWYDFWKSNTSTEEFCQHPKKCFCPGTKASVHKFYIYILSVCGLKDLTESKHTAVCVC